MISIGATGFAAIAALTLAANPACADPKSPLGVWINDTGAGAVEITECKGGLCGRVVWVKDRAKVKKACGLQIIGDAAPIGGGVYDKGWIYDPSNGMKFDVELTPQGATLQVMGYLDGDKSLSKTMTWTPAPADLERCKG